MSLPTVPRSITLPPELATDAFRGSLAVRQGLVPRSYLESPRLVRVVKDIYVARGREFDPDVRRQVLRLLAVDGCVVCGPSAAWLHGAWDPPPGQAVPLHVSRPLPAPGSTTAGVTRRRLTLRGEPWLRSAQLGYGMKALDEDVVTVDGIPVTSQVRTCFDLMRQRYLVEAVAVADMFAWRCGLPLPLLHAYCADRRRWPGVREARVAADLAVPNARSPGETRLRLLVLLAGYPEPFVNVAVRDEDDAHIAVPDLLLWTGRWTGLEYDGGYHDEGPQPKLDRRRGNAIARGTDFPVLRYDAEALLLERRLILADVADVSGRRPTQQIDERDFFRGLRR